MLHAQPKFARVLSLVIAVLTLIAAAGGLFLHSLYRDNTWVSTQLRGNDLVTLVVALPLLLTALILSMRGSQRAQLVWLGMLWYILYGYAFYLFGAAFNQFFLIYAALFALSMIALIVGLSQVDINRINPNLLAKTPVKWIGVYMLFWAVLLGGLWVARSLSFVATGKMPQDIIDSGIHTGVVYALDLSLLVPYLLLSALWLWKRQPRGYVLATLLNVKGTVYALALIFMGVFQAKAGVPGGWNLVPLWAFFTAASLVASLWLLGNIEPANR
jgi:hypothetical protein